MDFAACAQATVYRRKRKLPASSAEKRQRPHVSTATARVPPCYQVLDRELAVRKVGQDEYSFFRAVPRLAEQQQESTPRLGQHALETGPPGAIGFFTYRVDNTPEDLLAHSLVRNEEITYLAAVGLVVQTGLTEKERAAHEGDGHTVGLRVGGCVRVPWIDESDILHGPLELEQIAIARNLPQIAQHRNRTIGCAAGQDRFSVLEVDAAELPCEVVAEPQHDLGQVPVDPYGMALTRDERSCLGHQLIDLVPALQACEIELIGDETSLAGVSYQVVEVGCHGRQPQAQLDALFTGPVAHDSPSRRVALKRRRPALTRVTFPTIVDLQYIDTQIGTTVDLPQHITLLGCLAVLQPTLRTAPGVGLDVPVVRSQRVPHPIEPLERFLAGAFAGRVRKTPCGPCRPPFAVDLVRKNPPSVAFQADTRQTEDLEANALLPRLLVHLVETAPAVQPVRPWATHDDLREYVERACQFMVNHFAHGIGGMDVTCHIGFERSYFSKVFSRITGTTIRDYLARLRQQRAEELLRRSDLPIEAIAHAVGYDGAKVFSRFFKHRTGASPRTYRQRI